MAVCLLPVLVGFIVPVGVLLSFVIKGYSVSFDAQVVDAALNSLTIGLAAAILVIATAAFMGLVATFQGGAVMRRLTALASFGYAFPGTILAIGIVTAGGAVDRNLVGIYQVCLRPDLRGVADERGRLDCLCLCNSLSGRRLWRRDDRDRACFA